MRALPHTPTQRSVCLGDLWTDAPNWSNPREFTGLADADLAELGESIKARGIVDPPKVQRCLITDERGREFEIDLVIDGQRRIMAGQKVLPLSTEIPVLDLSIEPIRLTPAAADELFLKALTTLDRKDLSSYELVQAAMRMKERGKTGKYIAGAIKRSETWVSKMTKAMATATKPLAERWRAGEITDEQFKDLAGVAGGEQKRALESVISAREGGDKAEARIRAKEVLERSKAPASEARSDKPAKPVKGAPAPNGVPVKPGQPGAAGTDYTMPPATGADPHEPAPPKRAAGAVLEDMLALAQSRPPTSDYARGVVDCLRFSLGHIDQGGFGKAWTQYVARCEGRATKPKKK